jgi:hypothetical protein
LFNYNITYNNTILNIVDCLFGHNIDEIKDHLYNIINDNENYILESLVSEIVYNRGITNIKNTKIKNLKNNYGQYILSSRRPVLQLETFIVKVFFIINA